MHMSFSRMLLGPNIYFESQMNCHPGWHITTSRFSSAARRSCWSVWNVGWITSVVKLETEMKELAETTRDNFKEIYQRVCLKNPAIARRIPYNRICKTMDRRRREAQAFTTVSHGNTEWRTTNLPLEISLRRIKWASPPPKKKIHYELKITLEKLNLDSKPLPRLRNLIDVQSSIKYIA